MIWYPLQSSNIPVDAVNTAMMYSLSIGVAGNELLSVFTNDSAYPKLLSGRSLCIRLSDDAASCGSVEHACDIMRCYGRSITNPDYPTLDVKLTTKVTAQGTDEIPNQ